MTGESLSAYVGLLFVCWVAGYGVGLKIRAFRDFMNSI